MSIRPFPGYEKSLVIMDSLPEEERKKLQEENYRRLLAFQLPEGMSQKDDTIFGAGDEEPLSVRVYTPAGLPEKAPMLLDIHGGGWIRGDLDTDNFRASSLAIRLPAIVVSVAYRLSDENVHYPIPLQDCLRAYRWMKEQADALGGDAQRIGIHGSSAGGNLAAGLALKLRDLHEDPPKLTVLNCPVLTTHFRERLSYYQNQAYRHMIELDRADGRTAEEIYLGGFGEAPVPAYAFPGDAHSLSHLGPHMILVGEYDPLRDEGIQYAIRLMQEGVPCELLSAPRVGHCFTGIQHPYTDQVHDLIATSFRREFGMLDFAK